MKTSERRTGDERAELQAWYLWSLFPKLSGAASAGTVARSSVATLDGLLRDLLDLPSGGREEAA